MSKRVLVTGGTGMVGNALQEILPEAVYISRSDCDLRDKGAVEKLFQQLQPQKVIHLAARVGGVKANQDKMGEFFFDNVMINTNVLHTAYCSGVDKLLSLMSTCVYPIAECVSYPLTEDQLYSGKAHHSNFAYAYTKRMLDVQSRAYRLQYNCNFITAIPNNLYGPHDNFDLNNGHVVPAIMRKVYEAKLENRPAIDLWGDGTPMREFTFSKDAAAALIFLLNNYEGKEPINIGCTKEISIRQLSQIICQKLEYTGEIIWDTHKPKGQMRKPSSNANFLELGWNDSAYSSIEKGLGRTCSWFKENYPDIRGY